MAQVAAGMTGLSELMADPARVVFDEVADSFEELERVLNAKAALDAAFAWLAEQSPEAGQRVGSTRGFDYLLAGLGLSKKEAAARLRTGRHLFDPPAPAPAPAPEPAESEEEHRAREAAEREKADRERKAREEARRRAQHRSAEILGVISQELANLNEHADPGSAQLYNLALAEAGRRTPEDLRSWLRDKVTQANQAGMPDLLAAYRKRFLHLGEADADGGRRVTGYLPAGDAAKLAAALAPGLRAGVNLPDPTGKDPRTLSQRAVDQLSVVLDRYLANQSTATRYGVGSVLFSVTAEDVESLSAHSTFSTNTGDTLNLIDVLRLGAAKFDVMALHDTDGQPLALGRGVRHASFFQKVALFAAQGVCGCPDCVTAAVHGDAHHLKPWDRGGPTDLVNLMLICRPHHADNDDSRSGAGGKGHADRCPTTGRVGRRAGPGQPLRFNTTHAQDRSAGARIRNRRDKAPADRAAG
ncbi:hypothetical protein CETAM_01025 [Corynebacterium comes]|uniref:HNH endonuclease n=1 Tax=Corynebacterium comes TaxID=2675218 RepID=A0A6B8W921_9CORY|nr:hypothetical protein CETAM_01025 [Corynebacterium comes]